MARTMKDASMPNNSKHTSTSTHETSVIPKLAELLLQLREINDYFMSDLQGFLKEQHGEKVFNEIYCDNLLNLEGNFSEAVYNIGNITSTLVTDVFYGRNNL